MIVKKRKKVREDGSAIETGKEVSTIRVVVLLNDSQEENKSKRGWKWERDWKRNFDNPCCSTVSS